ncbi:MAG TPA: hypothetical protein VMW91_11035 [Desulfosporosinus sp.]|nr:hypothetical protein [Desulfosporosinus sp.]
MRSWIVGATLIISYTLAPDMVYPPVVSVYGCFLIIAGVLADVYEFKAKI